MTGITSVYEMPRRKRREHDRATPSSTHAASEQEQPPVKSEVVLDNDRLGLHTLWPLKDDSAHPLSSTTVDVVALHGLDGDSIDTWTDQHSGKLWLVDFLPADVSDAHIMSFGYNSRLAFSGSSSGIDDFASSLLQSLLARRRRAKTQSSPLVFICHSLGGIVFKKALILAHERLSQYRDLLSSIKGVMFLGTPHRGSDLAYWGRILGNIVQMPLSKSVRTDLLRDLRPKSEVLGNICSQFVERAVPLEIITVYERVKIKGLTDLVVDKDSAVLHLPNESTMPIECDHITMCKFRSNSSPVYEVVSDCVSRLIEAAKGVAKQIHEPVCQQIIKFCRPPGPARRSWSTVPQVNEGTVDWAFDNREFRLWFSSTTCRILWAHGVSGTGKTVLARAMLEHVMKQRLDHLSDKTRMRHEQPELVVFYFFSRRRAWGNSFAEMAMELVAQLLECDPKLVEYIPKLYWHDKRVPDVPMATNFFKELLQNSNGPRIRIIVDGLDESADDCSELVVSLFSQMLDADYFSRLAVLLTDRRQPLAPLCYVHCPTLSIVEVGGEAAAEDVTHYIRARIDAFTTAKRLPEEVNRNVTKSIRRVARGNFLHAKLAMDSFIGDVTVWNRSTVKSRLSMIEGMPSNLESHYCYMLSLIKPDFKQQARIVFALTRFAASVFTIREIEYAITLADSHSSFADVAEDLPFNLADDLPYICGSILQIKKRRIQFYHESALQLFECQPSDDHNASILRDFQVERLYFDDIMARICLRILKFTELRLPRLEDTLVPFEELSRRYDDDVEFWKKHSGHPCRDKLHTAIQQHPLMLYATRSWELHITPSSQIDVLEDLIAWLHTRDAQYMLYSWSVLNGNSPWLHRPSTNARHDIPVVHLVIRFGDMPTVLKQLFANGHDPNVVHDSLSPLSCALKYARRQTVDLLLSMKTVSFLQPPGSAGPLHYALDKYFALVADTHPKFLKTLLEDSRSDVNARDKNGETPLHWLLCSEYVRRKEWKQLLAVPSLNINSESNAGLSVFAIAFRNHRNEAFILELLKRSDVNIRLDRAAKAGLNVIMTAESLGWKEVEDELLSRFPFHPCCDPLSDGHNVLTKYASMGRREQVLKILHNIPQDRRREYRENGAWSLISLCAHQDWPDVIKLLRTSFGARFPKSDHLGRTKLHWMVENSWEFDQEAEDLAKTSSLNTQDKDGKTALHLAAETSNTAAGQWLLDHGALYSLPDKYGMNAVHSAGEAFCRGILALLLESEATEFGRDRHRRTLLHFLAKWSDMNFILDFCAMKHLDIEARDADGRTPLHYAALCSNVDATTALLDLGAFVDAIDRIGHSPLHYAIRNGNLRNVELLLEGGANKSTLSRYLQTNAQLAARSGQLEIMRLFSQDLQKPRHLDKFQQTIFHYTVRALGKNCNAEVDECWWDWLFLCVEAGADPNRADYEGYTALHFAVFSGRYSVVEGLLKDFRVRRSARDAKGCTALDWAVAAGKNDIVDLLKSCGAVTKAGDAGWRHMRQYWRLQEPPTDPDRARKLQIVLTRQPYHDPGPPDPSNPYQYNRDTSPHGEARIPRKERKKDASSERDQA